MNLQYLFSFWLYNDDIKNKAAREISTWKIMKPLNLKHMQTNRIM